MLTQLNPQLQQRLGLSMPDIAAFCQHWQIVELVLFGSILREDFRDDSDIDLLLHFSPQARQGLLTLAKIKHELETRVGRKVDIVLKESVENSESWIRRNEILKTAQFIEWMFDLNYPGHYMRRIKNVTLTIPCVVDPYTGVDCRLTLLSSTTRVDPRLSEPPAICCDNGRSGKGYQLLPDDPRAVKQYAATEAIATSSGQNDSGLFELGFRDERYLPFEFAGAISRWRIELPQENNQFDMDTLSDVVLHLNYMAREGGEILRRAANEIAQQHLPDAGWRFFDVKHEFPDAWHRFQNCPVHEKSSRQLALRLGRNMFAFLPGHRDLLITRLELFYEAPGAEPSTHQVVKFLPGHRLGHEHEEECECEVFDMICIASADWPGLYHGVLDIQSELICHNGEHYLGTFKFPPCPSVFSRAFLFCCYDIK